MKKIEVTDITLRALSEERQNSFSFREKLNMAQMLEKTGVDTVELPAPGNEKEDVVVYRTIASSLQQCQIAMPVGLSEESLLLAWECIKDAAKPILQIVLPTSTVQMEYMCHWKAPVMLEQLGLLCKKGAECCGSVEFVALDATRADAAFLAQCCQTAKENGADTVTLCDDAGVAFPEDLAALVRQVKEACGLRVFVQPSNALKLAAACAVEALRAGADGIKTTICDQYLSADVLADILRAKGDGMGLCCGLDFTGIHHILSHLCDPRGAVMESRTQPATQEEILLEGEATLADVMVAVEQLGYELSEEDHGKVYQEFKRVVAKKKVIHDRELEAIVASASMQVPSTFHVVNYVVNSGNIITATANLTLEKDGEELSGVATGDGPIDAAFHAIEQIIGHRYELDDFQVQSVTKGREAVGSSLIRLRANGKLYSGNGVSTDVIGACIRAYVNALNKIVYEGK